jgi:hypothetical protein
MGEVYAAFDSATGRHLALKRLSPGATASMAALFEREYQVLAGLKHPCIVEVYEYGTDSQGPFYSMELIEGGDLSKAAPMQWRDACRVLRDGASVLGLLHARHLLHRDVSPRNFLFTPDGRLKLIDFGALASFGTNKEVIGTPPFIPPEALQTQPLDQRSDIFGLGALGYWLLTGTHAFPARSLNELPELWKREPTSPSDMLGLLPGNTLEPVPAELDALIASMLRVDQTERLQGTAELIDRLNAVADLTPESETMAVQGYLDSKAFVGRTRERERALSLLGAAEQGRVQTLLIEGEPGVGRTRLMRELVVSARVAGALAVVVDEGHSGRPYGYATALLLRLLQVLPEPTRALLAQDAALLGSISAELREQLGGSQKPSIVHGYAELRLALLTAMRKAILHLSRDRLLALFIDDAQEIDEESQALLAALSGSDGGHRLLLVLTLARDSKKDGSSTLVNLRASASRLRLLPLTPGEVLELLRSVFGQAPFLERLAERLHRASEGNPAYCLELAEHLVHTGAATYREGAWMLPPELSQESLPANRYAAQVAKLDHLSPEARSLACLLSIPHELVFTHEQCVAVAALPEVRVHELLVELVRDRVLLTTADGHRFARADVQGVLLAELSEASRLQAHRRLGHAMSADATFELRRVVRSALHFFHGGELERGYAALRRVYAFASGGDGRELAGVAPMLEELYAVLSRLGHDEYRKLAVLSLLGMCGFFSERRYADKYGDLAVATGERLLRLGLAKRLSPFFGGKLALIVALVVGGMAFRRRKEQAPPMKQVVQLFIAATTALAGTACICMDGERSERYANVLRTFAVFGRDHVAAVTHQFVSNMVSYQHERLIEAERRMTAFIERLSDPAPIRDLPGKLRDNYIAGMLMNIGVLQSWCDTDKCLATADRLEQFSPLHAMSADHLRSSYYSSQGEIERAEYYRKRVEMHAVELGSAWQVDTWATGEGIKIGLRTNNAAVLKRTVQELSRLSRELPWLADVERSARGCYLVLRGKYAEAIPLLQLPPGLMRLGGTRANGVLARAHNALGHHAEAREICLAALAQLEPEESKYVVMTLNVHIELALAEAGLQDFAAARKRLDELLVLHAPGRSAITLGSLHQARAQVALRERNFVEAREHLDSMENYYLSTRLGTLIELVAPLRREIDRTEHPHAAEEELAELRDRGHHLMMRVQWLLSHTGESRPLQRAQKGLQLALELTNADEGFLVLAGNESASVAHLGNDAPSEALVRWAEQSMLEADADEQTLMTAEVDSIIESNYKVVGETRYCVMPLWGGYERQQSVVAALVLGFDNRVPQLPEPALMQAIARHLAAENTNDA